MESGSFGYWHDSKVKNLFFGCLFVLKNIYSISECLLLFSLAYVYNLPSTGLSPQEMLRMVWAMASHFHFIVREHSVRIQSA